MSKLTKDTTIGEILKNYSNAQDVLKGFGMHCFACPMSQMETIEQAGAVHGLDIDFMMEKLNADLIENKVQEKPKRTCCRKKKD